MMEKEEDVMTVLMWMLVICDYGGVDICLFSIMVMMIGDKYMIEFFL